MRVLRAVFAADGAMDHDMHMGNGNMKNMALHMAYTDLRPANDADKARAAALVHRYGEQGLPARPVFDLLLKFAIRQGQPIVQDDVIRDCPARSEPLIPLIR